jgi:hypothetical protein
VIFFGGFVTILLGFLGFILIVVILWDAFETIILPRRVTRAFRVTRLFYHLTWTSFSTIARRIKQNDRREAVISYFGPLSLLLLLFFWAACLIVGFAVLQWSLGSQVSMLPGQKPFVTDLYLSLSAFFTLGFGDITPRSDLARLVALIEGGMGYGFLALIISYLPALTVAFARREVNVTMLDERAGTPPTAYRLLVRACASRDLYAITQFFSDWERWSAELMESHLSYPVLAYFRSQHENQSWVAALTMVLDLCALVLTGTDSLPTEPARQTFAIARHAAVDLTQIFDTPPSPPQPDRLPPAELIRLREQLTIAGLELRTGPEADQKIVELRAFYEPYLNALAHHLILSLPPWIPYDGKRDNWETTAWE